MIYNKSDKELNIPKSLGNFVQVIQTGEGGLTPEEAQEIAQEVVNEALEDYDTSDTVDGKIETALDDYTPTADFATINGSAITEGGDIRIQGGGESNYVIVNSLDEIDEPYEGLRAYVKEHNIYETVTAITVSEERESVEAAQIADPCGYASVLWYDYWEDDGTYHWRYLRNDGQWHSRMIGDECGHTYDYMISGNIIYLKNINPDDSFEALNGTVTEEEVAVGFTPAQTYTYKADIGWVADAVILEMDKSYPDVYSHFNSLTNFIIYEDGNYYKSVNETMGWNRIYFTVFRAYEEDGVECEISIKYMRSDGSLRTEKNWTILPAMNYLNEIVLPSYARKNEFKTINGNSIIGEGDITIQGGGGQEVNYQIVDSLDDVVPAGGGSAAGGETITITSSPEIYERETTEARYYFHCMNWSDINNFKFITFEWYGNMINIKVNNGTFEVYAGDELLTTCARGQEGREAGFVGASPNDDMENSIRLSAPDDGPEDLAISFGRDIVVYEWNPEYSPSANYIDGQRAYVKASEGETIEVFKLTDVYEDFGSDTTVARYDNNCGRWDFVRIYYDPYDEGEGTRVWQDLINDGQWHYKYFEECGFYIDYKTDGDILYVKKERLDLISGWLSPVDGTVEEVEIPIGEPTSAATYLYENGQWNEEQKGGGGDSHYVIIDEISDIENPYQGQMATGWWNNQFGLHIHTDYNWYPIHTWNER